MSTKEKSPCQPVLNIERESPAEGSKRNKTPQPKENIWKGLIGIICPPKKS